MFTSLIHHKKSSMLRRSRRITTAGLTSLLLALSGAPLAASASTASLLQQDANHLHDTGTVGVLAEVAQEAGGHVTITKARAGTAVDGANIPVPWDSHMRIGSTTKTFVATVLLQLESEHKLSLNDTVEKWLPGVVQGNGNNGNNITVRQLLQQTSGLFDYLGDDQFVNTLVTPTAFYQNRFNNYTPQHLAAIAMSHAPDFAPGTSWEYSNTNYILAGMIIKAVTGEGWGTQVQKRIITPLGLTQTSDPGSNPLLPFPIPRGYETFDETGTKYDVTEDNMTWGASAGALISTPHDVDTFFRALLQGRLLPPAQMSEMKTTVPMDADFQSIWPGAHYGLGIINSDLPCGGTYWHHGGDVIGFSDRNGVSSDGRRSVMVASTTNTFADEQFAEDSTRFTNELVWNALCGHDTDPNTTATPATSAPAAQQRSETPSTTLRRLHF